MSPSYSNLTYKQKFIRTLWIFPLNFLFLLIPADYKLCIGITRTEIFIFSISICSIQLIYTFVRWRLEERKNV